MYGLKQYGCNNEVVLVSLYYNSVVIIFAPWSKENVYGSVSLRSVTITKVMQEKNNLALWNFYWDKTTWQFWAGTLHMCYVEIYFLIS